MSTVETSHLRDRSAVIVGDEPQSNVRRITQA